jgi:hypothetical protein
MLATTCRGIARRFVSHPVIVASALTLLQAGCGYTHLYNRGNHQLATKASERFAAAELDKSLETEQRELDLLKEQELQVVRRQGLARRDAGLLAIVAQRSVDAQAGVLLATVAARRSCLIGSADLGQVLLAIQNLDTTTKGLVAWETTLTVVGAPGFKPACPLGDLSSEWLAAREPEFRESLDGYRSACTAYLADRNTLSEVVTRGTCPTRDYKTVLDQIAAAENFQADTINAVQEQLRVVEAAKRSYEEAIASGTEEATVETLAAKLDAALNDLGKAEAAAPKVITFLGLNDLNLEGRIAKIETQREALRELLEKVSASEAATAEGEEGLATAIAHSLPIFERGVRNAFDPATPTPLLMELGRLQVELEALQRRLRLSKAQIELLSTQRVLMDAELGDLAKASAVAGNVTSCGGSASQCVPLSNGILAFAASDTYSRVEQDVIQRQRVLLRQQAALDSSELALLGWHKLIGTAIEQLVAYHASGIKPETIAALLQAAGVGAIAGGVN